MSPRSLELRMKLKRARDLAEREVRKVLEDEADKLVAQMKNLAPVLKKPDPRRRAGALRDSITWTWGKAPKGTAVIGRVAMSAGAGIYITIYAGSRDKSLGVDDAFYAHMQEFGTEHHPASPFFYPVWRANRRRIRTRLGGAVKRGFRKANT